MPPGLFSALPAAAARRLWLLALATVLGALPSAAEPLRPTVTEPGPAPRSILWVGNSLFFYNNGIHTHFGRLVGAATPEARVRSTLVTISGAGLDWHDMDSLLRPGGLGRYSFVGENEIRFNPAGRPFDVAVMADCSQCPLHPQLQAVFHQTVRNHAEKLRRAEVRPVLFMTWAYADKPGMTAGLAGEYTRAGNENQALVIPAGLAFALVNSRRPGLVITESDRRHPNLAGTYLAACTAYAALFRRSPEGLAYTAGLPPEVAQVLQSAAWDAVEAYFGPAAAPPPKSLP